MNYSFSSSFLDQVDEDHRENTGKLIIQFEREHFSRPWKESAWESWLVDQDNKFWGLVFDADQELIGFSLYQLSPLEQLAHLLKVVISPKFRGQGLGHKLLFNDFNYLKVGSYSFVYLEVEWDNLTAIALYEKLNFVTLVQKNNFYGNGQHAISMKAKIN